MRHGACVRARPFVLAASLLAVGALDETPGGGQGDQRGLLTLSFPPVVVGVRRQIEPSCVPRDDVLPSSACDRDSTDGLRYCSTDRLKIDRIAAELVLFDEAT